MKGSLYKELHAVVVDLNELEESIRWLFGPRFDLASHYGAAVDLHTTELLFDPIRNSASLTDSEEDYFEKVVQQKGELFHSDNIEPFEIVAKVLIHLGKLPIDKEIYVRY